MTRAAPEAAGYAHPHYAAAFPDHGQPRALPGSGGWLLRRPIGDTGWFDAMGCYPLFACRDWGRLAADLADAGPDLVAVSLVTDPFGTASPADLRAAFPDLCRPFKEHFVTDLSRCGSNFPSPGHARNVRRARGAVTVSECPDPAGLLSAWCQLYDGLVRRHGIRGLTAFSQVSFARQLRVPGIRAFRADLLGGPAAVLDEAPRAPARLEGPAGMLLWYVRDDVAYYHLGAHSEAGYEARASFALLDHCCRVFATEGRRWLSLGAAAGATATATDGLTRFKRGWAHGTRPVYLCGRVLDPERYRELAAAAGSPTGYFPAYRAGEFA